MAFKYIFAGGEVEDNILGKGCKKERRWEMRKGFTLIELIMIIVILGILAAVAIPKYYDLQSQAQQAAEEGIVGGVRSGISTYYANQCAAGSCNATVGWPGSLDSASDSACNSTNVCFDTVLTQGVTQDWTRNNSTAYTGPAGTTYIYNNTTGNFQ